MIPAATPEAIAAETTPLYDGTWLRTTLDAIAAPVWASLGGEPEPCPTCGTVAGPCVTASGRVARERHVGRVG